MCEESMPSKTEVQDSKRKNTVYYKFREIQQRKNLLVFQGQLMVSVHFTCQLQTYFSE